MARLTFEVVEAWPELEPFEGILLMGRILQEGDLGAGDTVEVPTSEGHIEARCSGIPLINSPPERRSGWVGITVVASRPRN